MTGWGADNSEGVLETILAVDGVPVRLADHLARLDRSCRELYGAGLPAGVAERARAAAAGTAGRQMLRIVVDRRLVPVLTVAPAPPLPPPSAAVLVPRPAGLWRHKWADRASLTAAEAATAPGVPLFVAPDGTITETSRGNVFLLGGDGRLVTAPLRDDVLPGVTRRAVLDRARDEGRPTELRSFTPAELSRFAAFWTSSLSGAVPIDSVDGVRLPRADDLVAEYARSLFDGAIVGS
jgi:para-aminobenzoate synthetase/4-amino-4-deoxychorismate lyase